MSDFTAEAVAHCNFEPRSFGHVARLGSSVEREKAYGAEDIWL